MPDEQDRSRASNVEELPGTEDEKSTPGISRRSFLTNLSAATGLLATTGPVRALEKAPGAVEEKVVEAPAAPAPGTVPVSLTVNGIRHELHLEPRVTLLDCLRENLAMAGTKKGCDHGQCGACTVHVNGRRVNSCLSFAAMHAGDEITTIEGIGQPGNLHPMQASFIEHDGYQCGYCTSGQIMSAVALLKEPIGQDDTDVKEAMSGNICRCGAYSNIVAAVQYVRRQA
jgi:xanthine dehydrogenase YagT iron-sulfur-binding subunit